MKKKLEMVIPWNNSPGMKQLLLRMKLTLTVLFIAVLQTFAEQTYSQTTTLSVNLKNVSVLTALQEIEEQTDFFFLYSRSLIDVERQVDVKLKNVKIFEILDALFSETDVDYKVEEKQIILSKKPVENRNATEQQKPVTGKITNSSGIPLPGVNIVIKGTTIGAISDKNGDYLIADVPQDATLVFSFIGMKKLEIFVAAQSVIDVTLIDEPIGIEEVVAIGYGTMKKADLTGSVVRADIQTLQEQSNISVLESLHGTIPGVNVGQITNAGQDPGISIRGRNTISGTTSPLIILDGTIYRGSMVDINPNDIESIDVLKDASATAIYGSQAGNGVIIITSKKGLDLGKPIVSYSGSYSIQTPSKLIKMHNSEQYIDKIKQIYLTRAYLAPDYTVEDPTFDVASILPDKTAVDGYAAGTNTNWWNLLTNESGSIHDHTISIRGKSNSTNYFVSYGLIDQDNIIINDTYSRNNIRLNLENDIFNWLTLGVQSFFTISDYSGTSPLINQVHTLLPVCSPFDDQGNIVTYPYKAGITINPLLTVQADDLDKRYNLSANFYADMDIPFIKGLNYRANFSQNMIFGKTFNFDKTSNKLQGGASKSNSYRSILTFDNILNYKRTFNDHSFNATLVYGIEKQEGESTDAKANIFLNPALGYNSLESGQVDQRMIASSAYQENSLYSMGRLHYGYKNKYLLTTTIRRDAFSGFGANNKVGFFPSYALAWIASEESFLKDYSWLNFLKLRLSYGVNGNRTIGRYETLAKVNSAPRYFYGDGASAELAHWISSIPNDDLKWEKTATSNLGIDFMLFNRRISGYIDSYVGNTSDLLYRIEIPEVNGFPSVLTNIGGMKNKGIEFSVTGIPVERRNFSWDITMNFALNRNEVTSIKGTDVDNDGIEDNIVSSDPGNSIFIGKPYGVWYDYDIIGMWQIEDGPNIPSGFSFGTYKIRDISGDEGIPDGKWTAAHDRTLVGYKDPSYHFSIMNRLNYKKFEIKFFINSIQGGNNYYKATAAGYWTDKDNLKQQNSCDWDWWTPTNTDAKFRRLGDAPQSVGEAVHPYSSRSFIRLQDVVMSYSLSPEWVKNWGIRSLKLYVSGKNLKTWTSWEGWDPETGTPLISGGRPVLKSYSFGVNVDF